MSLGARKSNLTKQNSQNRLRSSILEGERTVVFIIIVLQQRYRPSDSNKNVDIKFSVHGAFLEEPSSGTLKVERF